jgi:RNA polymerase sigma factor, sigma-70 family
VAETGNPDGVSSFDEFFVAEYPRLVRVAMSAGATFPQAEEAAQEAALQAFRSWDRLTNPSAWSRKAVLHEYYKAIARDLRELELTHKALRKGSVADLAADSTEESDEVHRVRQAIRRLPRAQREVFALIYDGYGAPEIAMILGKTPETVRSNLREARRRLVRELGEPTGGDEESTEEV